MEDGSCMVKYFINLSADLRPSYYSSYSTEAVFELYPYDIAIYPRLYEIVFLKTYNVIEWSVHRKWRILNQLIYSQDTKNSSVDVNLNRFLWEI